MHQADSIHSLFADLDRLIARYYDLDSPLGYFPVIFRFVASHLRRFVATGFLHDAARMDQISLGLFNRYYEALQQYEAGEPPSRSWMAALEGSADRAAPVAQVIMLHNIPHLNLDLAVVVARACPGPALAPFRDEFFAMNRALAPLLDDVIDAVGEISPLTGALRGRLRRSTIGAAIGVVGGRTWALAEQLAPLGPAQQLPLIARADAALAAEARLLIASTPLLAPVRRLEPATAQPVIDTLLRIGGGARPLQGETSHARPQPR